MIWFRKKKPGPSVARTVNVPRGLWVKCNHCGEIIYKKEVERNLDVCPKCDYHFRISARTRLDIVLDDGTFTEYFATLEAVDSLDFRDVKKYKDRLKAARKGLDCADAFIAGEGLVEGRRVMIGVFEFAFMGGSMGSVVGEKIARLAETALAERTALVIFSSSGGARMQEGIFSLMQMAKTSAALRRLKEEGVPYISVLTDPTTGGVTASFAMLGDVIVAEPRALVGFAGPRVIEQTIRQKLPEGFQRAEYLLEHGMIDMIVDRKMMKSTLANLIGLLTD
ncbi:MAG TPA: acetyl-CoA carboxylase carboxyltransferase subunit beta [Deltaproteobacteria bacterium]|nr:acetyl-CoA carboxylase carboxyltransferase subunit beta [Deltaproteobacteria bacterium]